MRRHPATPAIAVFVCALVVGFAPRDTSAQNTLFRYAVEVEAGAESDTVDLEGRSDPIALTVTDPGRGTATGRAELGFGVNRVFSHVEAPNANNAPPNLMADARAQWADLVTISDPALNGTRGTMSATLRIDGFAELAATGAYQSGDAEVYGSWNAWIGVSEDDGNSFIVQGWFGEWFGSDSGLV